LRNLTKSLSPAREAGHDGSNRDTQHASRFRVAEVLYGHEQYDLPLLFRKFVEFTDDVSEQDGRLLTGLNADISSRLLLWFRLPSCLASLADEDIMHDSEQPGPHIATVAAGMKLIQRSNQALMDQVVGVLLAPKQSTCVPS
jgi:hypothetical protein